MAGKKGRLDGTDSTGECPMWETSWKVMLEVTAWLGGESLDQRDQADGAERRPDSR